MSAFKSIISGIGRLFSGGGGAGEKIVDAVDRLHYSDQEKADTDQKDLASARSMQLVSHGSAFDVLVDGINRLIRPGVTLWLIGGFLDWWRLPMPGAIDPFWLEIFMIIVTFWFGGRVLLKDLPKALAAIRDLQK